MYVLLKQVEGDTHPISKTALKSIYFSCLTTQGFQMIIGQNPESGCASYILSMVLLRFVYGFYLQKFGESLDWNVLILYITYNDIYSTDLMPLIFNLDNTVRLVDGSTRFEGRVEVLIGGTWGRVCHQGNDWTDDNMEFVCANLFG